MKSNVIKTGDKVEIRILQQVEKGRRLGEYPPAYRSIVENVQEDGSMELLLPIVKGKIDAPPNGVRLEALFYTRGGMYRCIAQIKNRYLKENVYLMLMELKSPLEKFQRREFYRFECIMDIEYMAITDEEAEIEDITDLKEHHRLTYPADLSREAIAVDISGGGIRFVAQQPGKEGGYLLMSIRLANESMDYLLEIVGKIVICQKMENEKYEYRVNFLMKDEKKRELIIKYIFEQERRSRQKG
ncbi:flagellar brake protein [Petralouisia muris]|jgi:c-di-GMP-binding flagellar brake protein YcgR|uniref:Flagellar brake protein n=1 Tax=Petralouisia muris TaxID=3032872 RepID=A0AC61RY01_9FIRM|nr:flagellar brake domain-containing protein [Petralouisia muris]TGY96825.1 flagellar brake protein [Petralouisia muris]